MFATSVEYVAETPEAEARFEAERQAAAKASGCTVQLSHSVRDVRLYEVKGPTIESIRTFLIESKQVTKNGELDHEELEERLAWVIKLPSIH